MNDYNYSGQCFIHPYVNEHGEPVERNPREYPYSYDAYMLWRKLPNDQVTGAVYSDRMEQWDRTKHDTLWQTHCKGYRYSNVPEKNLEAFMRAYNDNPELRIAYLMQCCNVSNGFPLWIIAYHSPARSTPK